MYRGTYKSNKRAVVTTAPDCVVYINGELALPSGANPNKKVPLQPLITSVNVNLGVNSTPGSASIDLHIPAHYLDDLYVGGQLTLTTMMEVKIYAKGHFTVGGAPRHYPMFWGVVTSLQESYAGGEQTVSLSCADILYWWQVSQINVNPSYMATQLDQTQSLNLRGHTFTGMNAFDIIYSLSRYVYGDSMNVRNFSFGNQQARSEPLTGAERKRMMAYWTLKWGRITNSIKMYGPTGEVLQGSLLGSVLTGENRDFFLRARKGAAKSSKLKDYEPFKQGNFDVSAIAPFSQKLSQLGAMELEGAEFESKLNLAFQARDAINYEFFMDVTGEIIFKPHFYNMDVRPNFPVSWIRDIDIISENFAENPPEATFLEATGRYTQNAEIGLDSLVQTRATYVDYNLVQKYGWRPGSFSSEFIGSTENGGPKALFYHLVDVLDQQNVRINSGTITIPFRPELRLGYPIYHEGRDAYYYVEAISHNFSYGSRCTTSLTLSARRQKFYGAFERWQSEQTEPRPGDIALPGDLPRNIYARQTDAKGRPQGDRNVVLTYLTDTQFDRFGETVPTFQDGATDSDKRLRNLVSLRSQFSNATANKYVYLVDPARDTRTETTDENNRLRGPITHLESDAKLDVDLEGVTQEVNATTFPISDEAGYEVVGAYEYGRRVMVSTKGYTFDRTQDEVAVELLLNLAPSNETGAGRTSPDTGGMSPQDNPASAYEANALKDNTLMLDPNNYGRLLSEIAPPELAASDPTLAARILGESEIKQQQQSAQPATAAADPQATVSSATRNTGLKVKSNRNRTFKYNSNVARWRPAIREARAELGYSEEQYPDALILAVIHTESSGNPSARRYNSKGEPAEFVGLMQIGKSNANDLGATNTDFDGEGEASIRHFLQYVDQYEDRHMGDPTRIALLWKGGPGTLKRYNAYAASPGVTDADLDTWLAEYPTNGYTTNPKAKPWGMGNYLSDEESARQVWEASLEPVSSNEEITEPQVKPSAVIQGDEATDPEAANLVNVQGIPSVLEDDDSDVRMFAQALEANREQGVNSLPTSVLAPRDRGILDALNAFLIDLYDRDHVAGKGREATLRGEDRVVTTQLQGQTFGADTPRILAPIDDRNVDNTLARQELRDRLDAGETLGQVIGSEFRNELEQKTLDIERAGTRLGEEVSTLTGRSQAEFEAALARGSTLTSLLGARVVVSLKEATSLTEDEIVAIILTGQPLDKANEILSFLENLRR
jgi:soluble lytic murein transglycosylase-like protein